MGNEDWAGEERRTIPVHLVEYIDGRLDDHTSRVEQILKDHIKDETAQINMVFKGIKDNNDASEARHNTLMAQLSNHAGWQQRVEEAFLRDPHGTPDFHGHHDYHHAKRRATEWWDSVKDKTLTKIIEWSVVAFLSWAGFSLWQSFLKGPHT